MPTKIEDLRDKLEAQQKELAKIFEEAGPDLDMANVKAIEGDSAAKVLEIQRRNKELSALGEELDALLALSDIGARARKMGDYLQGTRQPVGLTHPGGPEEAKTLGELVMEQKDKLAPGGPPVVIDLKAPRGSTWLKTLFETAAGWAAETTRIPRVELLPARELVVADLVPQIPTSQAAVVYMEETTATFAAAEKAEGATYAESAFVLTERTETVRKITTSLPITDEQLADVPAAEAYINQRLGYDIRRRLDLQILEGTGVAPLLLGTLNVTGIQAQAKGTDTVLDAIYKCFDLIRTNGFAEPDLLFMNPTDWQPVRLLQTADGIYIMGSPIEAGPDRVWGKRLVLTTAVTVNTALCGDYRGYSALYVRSGLELSLGYNTSDFVQGKKTLRADMRVAMVHFRPKAFGKITGI